MLYTSSGQALPGVALNSTQVHISRGAYPGKSWHPAVIAVFPDDPATEAILTDPSEISLLREESAAEGAILTTTHYLGGLYQTLHEGGNTYVWLWLTRTERGERLNPAALEELPQRTAATEDAIMGLMALQTSL